MGAFIAGLLLWSPSAKAEEQMSTAVNALSVANIAFGATNVISGAKDCACQATSSGKPCPMFPWGTCMMLAASVPTLLSALSQAAQNRNSGKHLDTFNDGFTVFGDDDGRGDTDGLDTNTAGTSGGPAGPGGGLPPNAKLPPLAWGEFCSKTPDFCNDCAKGGDFSGCKPEMVLPDSVDTAMFDTPELQQALAAFQQAADLVNSTDHSGLGDGAIGEGDDSDFGFASEDGEAYSDPIFVKKQKGIGLTDKTGLEGASIWGMDMVDEKSGAKLTLFQRATRRYYGVPDLKRLNFLARAEFVRARAILHAKSILKIPAKRAPTAKAVSAPDRAPASEADQSAPALVPAVIRK
jgi:hypothetical protein